MLTSNWLALLITFTVALAWLRINDFAAHRGWIGSHLSRKFIHIGTGPLFVLCWLLFSAAPASRFLAALVPLLFTLQFVLIGLGIVKDEASVQAMSRTGDRREILKGPVYYGLVFVVMTVLYWLESPIGMVALMLMCGGDGLADIIGRRFGTRKLPWNAGKSWAGSLGMLLGGWILAILIVWVYCEAGVFTEGISTFYMPITLIAVVGALVESLPFNDVDNISVTLAAVILGHLVF